jgi:hypothetical protein
MEVVGSRIGEFPDPRYAMQGEDFGGLIWRSQEPGGELWSTLGFTAPDLQHHIPKGPPSMFFSLMVGAPGSPAPPPKGPLSMFLSLMLGTPGSLAMPPRGPAIDVSYVDGGRSRISGTAAQGACCPRFFH